MSLDFINNLTVQEETPLIPLTGEFVEESKEESSKEEIEKTPSSDIMPIAEWDQEGLESEDPKGESPKPSIDGKYKALIQGVLEKAGLERNIDDLEDTPEAAIDFLQTLVDESIESTIEEYKTQSSFLNAKFNELVENGVSMENAADIVKGFKSIEGITPEILAEDTEKARALYTQYLKETTKFSNEKIKKEIERLEDLGELNNEAVAAYPELKSIIETKDTEAKANEAAKREAEKQAVIRKSEELKSYLESTDEIGGMKLSKTMKDKWKKEYGMVKVGEQMVQPITAQRLKNPTEFDALVRFYNSLGLFNYNEKNKKFEPNLTAIKNLGTSEATSKLKNIVETEQQKQMVSKMGRPAENSTETSKDENLKRLLEVAKKTSQLLNNK